MASLEDGKISSGQFLAFLVLIRMLAALIDAPTISGTSVEHDAWISIILSTLLAIPWGLFLVHLSSMFPGMTIIEYSQVILGPWLGRIVGLVFILFFLQQSAYSVRTGSAAYVTTIMPETPILVFVSILTYLSANAARSGIEVLARASNVSFFVTLVMLVLLLILPINIMDFSNLLPIMARRWQPVQEGMLSSFAIYGELIVMTMLIPYLSRPQDAGRFAAYALLLSGFLFTWFTIAIAAVFGPVMSTLIMPAFSLGRMIQFALAIERVEVIPLVGWTISAGVKQSLFLWAAMLGIAQWFNLAELRALAYPVGALVATLSIWLFKGIFDATDFLTVKRFGTLSILVSVGIPVFLYIMAMVQRAVKQALEKRDRGAVAIQAISTGDFEHKLVSTRRLLESAGDRDTGFVTAAGADKAVEPDKVQLTVQIARPAALVTTTGGGSATERAFWLVSSTGYTIFDATRNFASQSSRRLFWAHNRWLVIGEEMAREGLQDILDFFVRDGETRRTVKLAVFKGGKASDFLTTELEMERLSSEAYVGIIQNASIGLSTVVDINIHQFLLALAGEGIEPVAIRVECIDRPPDVDIRGQMERSTISLAPRITGAAVFRGFQLVGWLDKPETRGYNWVVGKAKSGILVIERPEDENKYVGIELMRASSKVKPEIVNGKPRVTVTIQVEGAVGDIEDMSLVTDSRAVVASMERRMATVIANEINAALARTQELGSDIFGFGQAIYQRYPKEWRHLRENWNDQGFRELEVKMEVKSKIRRSGLTEIGLPIRR